MYSESRLKSQPREPQAPACGGIEFDPGLLARYDVRGPRYTSYPSAPQFSPDFDEVAYRRHVAAHAAADEPLSVYVHVPFCRTVCFYCGCNKVITANYRRAAHYLERLAAEMRLQSPLFAGRPVTQLHFGGGTPTYLEPADLARLMGDLGAHFRLDDGSRREFSIEIDPRTVNAERVEQLAGLGFNRMSLGVQDFEPRVQRAVNRVQSVDQTEEAIHAARASGFASVNVDLIYGLPAQTPESFARTLDTVTDLRPDRLAVYGYAHLPELFKVQRQIDAAALPDARARLRLLELSIERLTAAGYVYIGMDHFALPGDELTRALADGTLQRNFQGYSTQAESDLVGLGVSAIGLVGGAYVQNDRDLAGYGRRLDAGRLPVARGAAPSPDDRVRRDVIQALMCRGRVEHAAIEARHGVSFTDYFAAELARLEPLADDGLLRLGAHHLAVTPRGRLLVRNVAMAFDAYLAPAAEPRFSRAI